MLLEWLQTPANKGFERNKRKLLFTHIHRFITIANDTFWSI